MNKFLLLITFSIFCFSTSIAQIAVKSFRILPTDQTARITDPMIDQNGEKCALIKVVTTETGFGWEGGMLGITKVEPKLGEFWVYVPHGAKKITIKHAQLGILRDYIYTEAIYEATVYEMVLTSGKVVTTVVDYEILSEWVIITSEPEGADIYIDEINLGQTPFQQELKEGKHTFRISKDLYHTEAGVFQLSVAEGKKQLNYTLKPNFGYISVSSQPESGATVFINGKEQKSKTPFTTNRLKSGNHTVSVSKQMYGTYETTVTVSDNQTTEVNASLSARFGNLTVNSKPESGAELSIDGQPSEKTTSCTIEKLASGEHTLTLRQQWYETKKVKITIADGENKTETVILSPTFAEIKISTNPNANIYIDNNRVGNGTYTGRVVAGLHTFEARKDKHHNDSKKLELISGTTKEISLHPKPMYGTLKIVSTPFSADYVVKSKLTDNYTGTTPNTIRKLLVGEYTVTLSKTGYSSETRTVNIKENETKEINIELSSGKQITINSAPQGAKLYIDNNYKGITPFTTELIFKKYNVKLSKAKYKELTQSIEINTNSKNINLTLKRFSKQITINSTPQGAKLYINNEYKGTTPYTTEFSFGKHDVKLSKAYYKDLTQSIEINTYSKNINLNLESIIKEIPGMVFVKAGTFRMGSNDGQSDEKPIHTVTIDDFYIGKYEVTQKQWKEIMGKNPSKFKGDNRPVESVSWNDVQDFIKKLNRKTGKYYRLPTEAEWEYAARGGVETIHESSQTKYAGSNNIDNVAWYTGGKTHNVGTKQANKLGIYDMSGNVWEWCNDRFGSYSSGSQNNPQGASSGSYRVYRGGSWISGARGCRVANRYNYSPNCSDNIIGFRLALSLSR